MPKDLCVLGFHVDLQNVLRFHAIYFWDAYLFLGNHADVKYIQYIVTQTGHFSRFEGNESFKKILTRFLIRKLVRHNHIKMTITDVCDLRHSSGLFSLLCKSHDIVPYRSYSLQYCTKRTHHVNYFQACSINLPNKLPSCISIR